MNQPLMLPFEEFEQWLDVPDWEGYYQVSDKGRVRSLDRTTPFKGGVRRWRGCMMRITLNRGYPSVALSRASGRETWAIHRLVMLAFVGRCPDGMVVCHGPGGALDASRGNLSYGTQKKNCSDDRLRDGTLSWGETHGASVLTDDLVRTLRERYLNGGEVIPMMKELGVSRTAIDSAICGKTWRHLPGAVPLRGAHGEAAPWSKLTEAKVREIRVRAAAGEPQKLLAQEFGVGDASISNIVHRRHWKHVA